MSHFKCNAEEPMAGAPTSGRNLNYTMSRILRQNLGQNVLHDSCPENSDLFPGCQQVSDHQVARPFGHGFTNFRSNAQ